MQDIKEMLSGAFLGGPERRESLEVNIKGPEKHIEKMRTTEGFIETFYLYRADYSSDYVAYEATERFYKNHFGERKYPDFETFWSILTSKR